MSYLYYYNKLKLMILWVYRDWRDSLITRVSVITILEEMPLFVPYMTEHEKLVL